MSISSSFLSIIRHVWAEEDHIDQVSVEHLQFILNENAVQQGEEHCRFNIKRLLGEGGFGIVFEAFDSKLGRAVAIKVPKLERLLVPRYRKLFFREAESAASLDHPNIVAVHEVVECEPIAFIVSHYVNGPTLEQWLRNGNRPTHSDSVNWMIELAKAIQHAHEHGIIHRDIKPANILLDPCTTPDGVALLVPRLTDFGLAKSLHSLEEMDQTKTGDILGTPEYMSPEQAAGRSKDIGIATDIHALGVVLFRLLTGQLPFSGLSRAEIHHEVISKEAPRLRAITPSIPPDLEAICLKCLAKVPHHRYRSAYELEEELRAFLAGRPTKARPLSIGERIVRIVKKRPDIAAMTTGLVCLAIIFVSFVIKYERGLETAYFNEKRRANELAQVVYANTVKQASDLLKSGRQATALERLNSLQQSDLKELRGFEWRLLRQDIMSRNPMYLPGHESGVIALLANSSGRNVFSFSLNSNFLFWDLLDGRSKMILEPNEKLLTYLGAQNSSPSSIFLISNLGNIYSWSTINNNPQVKRMHFPKLKEIIDSKRYVGAASLPADEKTLVMGIIDQGILVIDLATGNERILEGGPWKIDNIGHLVHVYTCPDGHFAIASFQLENGPNRSHRFFLWNLKTDQYVGEIPGLSSGCYGLLDFGRAFDVVWIGSFGRNIIGINLNNLQVVHRWDGLLSQTRDYNFEKQIVDSPHWLAPDRWTIARDTRELVELDLQTGMARTLFHFHSPIVNLYRINSDELMAWSNSELIHLRSSKAQVLGRYVIPNELKDDRGEKYLMLGCYLPQLHAMAFSGSDGRIAIWKLDSKHPDITIKSDTLGVTWAAAFSPNSKLLATGGEDGRVQLWDTVSKTRLRTFKGNQILITSVAFSPDGKRLVSAGYDKQVRVWNVETGECIKVLAGHTQQITCAVWSHCGRYIAAGAKRDKAIPHNNSRVLIWEVATGQNVLDAAWHDDSIRCLAFHADGSRLYTGSEDRNIVEANWPSGKVLRSFLEPGEVWSLEARGDTLLATGKERSVSLWNLQTGHLERKWFDTQTSIRSHAWTPDCRTIITAGEFGPIRFWQAATGLELTTLETGKSRVLGVAISPDGCHLAAPCHDGKTFLWSIQSQEITEKSR